MTEDKAVLLAAWEIIQARQTATLPDDDVVVTLDEVQKHIRGRTATTVAIEDLALRVFGLADFHFVQLGKTERTFTLTQVGAVLANGLEW